MGLPPCMLGNSANPGEKNGTPGLEHTAKAHGQPDEATKRRYLTF